MEKADDIMGTEKIGKLVLKLGFPAVVAQLINVLYNMVDRMYIGHIPEEGAKALTGLGVCLPIIILISAFSAFVGMGGAPLASIELGKGDRERAEKIMGNGVTILLLFSVVLTVVFGIYKTPLLYMFGASDVTIEYANDYLNIYLIGTVFVQAALGLNMFITSQGQARIAMFSVLIGAILNIILDPIFIFAAGMGVKGAALATIISQGVSAIWVVSFLISEKSGLRIRLQNLKPDWKIIGSVAALGVSPFVMQSTESLINIVLNRGLQQYGGDLHVGALTIMQSVMQLIVIPVQGISQGTQPIISYNYGAGKPERVKQTVKVVFCVIFAVTMIGCLATCLAPEVFAKLFTAEQDMIELVGEVMPIFLFGIGIFGIQMTCQSAFMGLGQAKISLFLALLRKVLLLIPLALILPHFFGVNGIYYAEPAADILSAVTAGILFLLSFKKIIGVYAKEEEG